jgi:glycosyltransferase involved in cell wall biosynthesis
MKTRARVVMLLEDLEFGGTQRQALELAHRLDPGLFQVELWMMRSGRDFRLPAGDNGVTFRWLADTRTAGLRSILQTARHLKSKPVDVLVLLTAIPNIWGRLIGRWLKVPVILASIRGEGGPFRQHEKLLWRLADHHLCNSAALKAVMVRKYRIPKSRVSVIANGIDSHRFHPPPAGARAAAEPTVLCVARMVPDKDLMTLVSAFEILVTRRPDARLLLVGDGPLRREILTAGGKLPHGCFRWLPGGNDLLPLYHRASLFALSSVKEGFPNVVLEAMACGLPVVATRVGGIEEAVEHGRTGLLARPRHPRSLAELMLELLNDERRRAAYGEAGRRRVEERFGMDPVARSHERLFLRLMNAGSM